MVEYLYDNIFFLNRHYDIQVGSGRIGNCSRSIIQDSGSERTSYGSATLLEPNLVPEAWGSPGVYWNSPGVGNDDNSDDQLMILK
jgi:hypothetical protein